jgi:hypothetical protein
MTRYLPASDELETVFSEVLNAKFPGMNDVKFKLLFDSKKRVRKGRLLLASTELANEKLRYFTSDNNAPEG